MINSTKRLLHHLTLIFVWLLVFLSLTGCDQQKKISAEKEKTLMPSYQGTIIAVGDSLTAGQGVAENDAWPALVEKILHENGYNWQVINAGISGETSSGALARIKWILAQKPDIVILETGANDGLRGIPPAVPKKNIGKAVQMLRKGNVTVVLAGMQIVRNLGEEYTGNFAEIYPAVAEEHQILLIPFFPQGVAGEPSLNQADTIHPNEIGHKTIADTVYPYILQAIEGHR